MSTLGTLTHNRKERKAELWARRALHLCLQKPQGRAKRRACKLISVGTCM